MTSWTRRACLASCCLWLAAGCAGDGAPEADTPATTTPEARLLLPFDVEVDAQGRIYVADGELHQVLRFDPASGDVEVVAGNGRTGSAGDGGPAAEARINEPTGLALAPDGTLFIADFAANRVRRVDPQGDDRHARRAHRPRGGRARSNGPLPGRPAARARRLPHRPANRQAHATRRHRKRGDDRRRRPGTPSGGRESARRGLRREREPLHPGRRLHPPDRRALRRDHDDRDRRRRGEAPRGARRRDLPDGIGSDGRDDPLPRSGRDASRGGGTGFIGDDGEGGPAVEAEILPSDIALAPDGALILSQTEPEPAVRRIDLETGIITTLLR